MSLEKVMTAELIAETKYREQSAATGLKPGDNVIVTRHARSHVRGWQNSWVTQMTKQIGNVLRVESADDGYGYQLTGTDGLTLDYPFFVLQKTKRKLTESKVTYKTGGCGC